MAVLSKTCVCGSSIELIADSNPAEGMHVHILCLLCVE